MQPSSCALVQHNCHRVIGPEQAFGTLARAATPAAIDLVFIDADKTGDGHYWDELDLRAQRWIGADTWELWRAGMRLDCRDGPSRR